jgi:hypothetical protein
MVEALRCWIEVFQIAHRVNGSWCLTPIGRLNFDPKEGLDPYLEDVSTSWLLHWLISTNTSSPFFAWECVFNRWPAAEFSASQIIEAFEKEASRAPKCKIIVDDVTFPGEPPFQEGGYIAKAINDISLRNVLYFSAAANNGNILNGHTGTWEGDFFADSVPIKIKGKTGHFHLFASGTKADNLALVRPFCARCGNSKGRADLYWNDPLQQGKNEYDLFAVNARGDILERGNSVTDGKDPYQTVDIDAGQSLLVFQTPGAKDRFIRIDTYTSG